MTSEELRGLFIKYGQKDRDIRQEYIIKILDCTGTDVVIRAFCMLFETKKKRWGIHRRVGWVLIRLSIGL